MKDPGNFMTKIYGNLIDGLPVDGLNITLYDRVMGDSEDKYIVLDDIAVTDISDMDSHQFVILIDLQVITIFRDGNGGKTWVNKITNEILQKMYGANESERTDSEFRIYDTLLNSSFIREEDEQGLGYVVRKFVTIQHLVEQK